MRESETRERPLSSTTLTDREFLSMNQAKSKPMAFRSVRDGSSHTLRRCCTQLNGNTIRQIEVTVLDAINAEHSGSAATGIDFESRSKPKFCYRRSVNDKPALF
jgi:hypothetical protein